MPNTLDELIRPLGPRLKTARPFASPSPLSGPRHAPESFIRKYGLVILASGLSVAVAVLWAMQAGYLTLTPVPRLSQAALTTACIDPAQGAMPAKATSLREMQETVIPEIRSGYPPQINKSGIITLPPDMSALTNVPAPRPQTVPVPATKPAPKNKPAAKDVRP